MLPHQHNKITVTVVLLLFFTIFGYAYFEGRYLLQGPSILLSVPGETLVVHDSYVRIAGKAERFVDLRVNGKPIPVTEDGAFSEDFVLAVGYNQFRFTATDRAGRETVQDLGISYVPETAVPKTDTLPLTPTL